MERQVSFTRKTTDMKRPVYTFLCICLLACSPYKKVTVTMSDRLTNRWKGASEGDVVRGVGSFTSRETQPGGYCLHYNYSYALQRLPDNKGNTQVRVSSQPGSPMTPPPPTTTYHDDYKSASDSVIKRMDFYFDGAHHVQSVMATGFPDSVYYVKRK
jgi:hypothetical protein